MPCDVAALAAVALIALCLTGCFGLGSRDAQTDTGFGWVPADSEPAFVPYARPATPAFSKELASLRPSDITGFQKLPDRIQLLIEESVALSRRHLPYKLGADDPSEGGLDCSGFVHYALQRAGMLNIPRSSSDLCAWVRNSGRFYRVRTQSATTRELDQLKPGDLLFWTRGSASVNDVCHVTVYLGRRASDNRHIMAGASNRRDRNGGGAIYEFFVDGTYYGYFGPGDFFGYGSVPGLKEGRLNGGFSQLATTSR